MLRGRFKFSNVAALLALVLAISGGAYAASKIDGSDIKNKSIPNAKLKPKDVKGGKLATNSVGQRALKKNILNKIANETFFHTTEPGNTLSLGAGDPLEFSGVQIGQGITPVTDTEFRFDQNGTYRVTMVLSILKVNVPGTLLFTLDGVPTHLLTGKPTAGAQVVLDGVVAAAEGQVLAVVSETGLNVQLSSGTEATLTIDRLGPGMKPIRKAADPSAPEPEPTP